MALKYGRQPTNGRSRLTGLSDVIYKKFEANILPDALKGIDSSIKKGVMSGREGEKNKNNIRFQYKKLAYDIASSIIDYLKENIEFEIKGATYGEIIKIEIK